MARGASSRSNQQGEDEVTEMDTEMSLKERFTRFLLEFRKKVKKVPLAKVVEEDEEDEVLTSKPVKKGARKYYDLLKRMVQVEATTLPVDFRDLETYDSELACALEEEFARFDSCVRKAAKSALMEVRAAAGVTDEVLEGESLWDTSEIFVAFHSLKRPARTLRELKSATIGKLLVARATVTRSTETRPELLIGCFQCLKCGTGGLLVEQQLRYTLPTVCSNPQCENSSSANWQLDLEHSIFVDWQRVRIQESPDEIPAGSLPRAFDCLVRDEMVERCKAGDDVELTGIVCVVPDASGLARAGDAPIAMMSGGGGGDAGALKGKELQKQAKIQGTGADGYSQGVAGARQTMGCREMTYKLLFVASSLETTSSKIGSGPDTDWKHGRLLPRPGEKTIFETEDTYDAEGNLVVHVDDDDDDENMMPDSEDYFMDEDRQRLKKEEADLVRRVRATPDHYAKIGESVAPNIYGHSDVKHGVLLQLVGGVHKRTPEGIKLRGDINVCVVGDPSTAKSQFLKYVHGFSPRAVYTSGKAASAAGLTAAVIRDPDTGDFAVEAGALMLADNGICCIDEFGKKSFPFFLH